MCVPVCVCGRVSVCLLYAFNVIYNFWTPRCVFKFSSSDVSSYITQCSGYCLLPHPLPPLTLLCCRHTCSTAISLSISNAIYERRQRKKSKKKGEETQHKRKTSKSCWQSLNNISLLDPYWAYVASLGPPEPWPPPTPSTLFLLLFLFLFFVLVLRMCLEINKYVDGLRVCLCVCLSVCRCRQLTAEAI